MNEPENLILRQLRNLSAQIDRLEQSQTDTAAAVRSLHGHVLAFVAPELRQDGTIAAMQTRLDRIERRLDLTDHTPAD